MTRTVRPDMLLLSMALATLCSLIAPRPASAEEALAITGLEPAVGSVSGGDRVIIEGTGFQRGMALEVHFGETRALSMVVEDESHLLVTTPSAVRPGLVNVHLRLGNRTVTALRAFTYENPPEEPPDGGVPGVTPEGGEPGVTPEGGEPGEAPEGGEPGEAPEGGETPGGQETTSPEGPETTPEGPETTPPSQLENPLVSVRPDVDDVTPAQRYAAQIEADGTEIPENMGGIFVPALTDPTLEPAYEVYRDGNMIESARPATAVVVSPGRYLVRVGRGNDRVRPRIVVEVVANELTVVEPPWGALVIDVVNERNIPQRNSYDLIRQDTRETVGTGRGADRRTGEGLRTWLLIPGIYRIVQPGGTYRDRLDFATVQVNPGEAINFVLVIDSDGEFRGAGIVDDTDVRRQGGLELRGSIGGSVEFTHRYEDVGVDENELTFGGDVFVDFDLLYDEGWNYFWLQLQLEAGIQFNNDREWHRTLDYLDLSAIYILQAHQRIGPYIRFSFQSHMLPTWEYFEGDESVTVVHLAPQRDENEEDIELERADGVTQMVYNKPFSENIFQEGIGANWRAARSYYIDLDIRLGFGFRQQVNNERVSYIGREPPEIEGDDPIYRFRYLDDFTHNEGIDFGIIAAGNLTGWLSYDFEFVLLQPFTEPFLPIIDIDFTFTVRIFSFASLNYIIRVRWEDDADELTPNWNVEQAVLLRFAFNLF